VEEDFEDGPQDADDAWYKEYVEQYGDPMLCLPVRTVTFWGNGQQCGAGLGTCEQCCVGQGGFGHFDWATQSYTRGRCDFATLGPIPCRTGMMEDYSFERGSCAE